MSPNTSPSHKTDHERDAWRRALLRGDLPIARDRLAEGLHGGALASDAAAAWRGMAAVHLAAHRVRPAGVAFAKAVRLNPLDADAWAGLALAAEHLNKPRLAERAKRGLRTAAPLDDEQRLALARARVAMIPATLDQRARRAANATTKGNPLSELLEGAERDLQVHLARHPNRADAHHHLSVILNAEDEKAPAAIANRVALSINPNYAAADRFRREHLYVA